MIQGIGEMRRLERLDLSGNRIERLLPRELGRLGRLTDLRIDHNALSVLADVRDALSGLPSLASLFRAFAEMFEGADIDLAALGREQLAFWSAALRRCDDDLAAPGALDHAHVK